MATIRPIAICVFRARGRILVSRGSDPETQEQFFRPFGGGIEFGESAAEALVNVLFEWAGATGSVFGGLPVAKPVGQSINSNADTG